MQLQTEFYRTIHRICGAPSRPQTQSLPIDFSGQAANDLIRETLSASTPCMIGRFGSNELDATTRTYERKKASTRLGRFFKYLRGPGHAFWYDGSLRRRMSQVAGFFPATDESLQRFGERMLEDCQLLDILGSWRTEEMRIRHLFPSARTINLIDLEPFRHGHPWTKALEGKRVLVVHPFEKTIHRQYANRPFLFHNPEVLPDFELLTIRSVQSHGGNHVDFPDWFAALDSMIDRINTTEFDIALIGAGAYGLPLAAHVKRMGRKAVHLGGVLQLLFGIRGQRWDNGDYDCLFNEYWCRPDESEKPVRAGLVEHNAYW